MIKISILSLKIINLDLQKTNHYPRHSLHLTNSPTINSPTTIPTKLILMDSTKHLLILKVNSSSYL